MSLLRRRRFGAPDLERFLTWDRAEQRSWLRHPAVKSRAGSVCACGEYAMPWREVGTVADDRARHSRGRCQPWREVL